MIKKEIKQEEMCGMYCTNGKPLFSGYLHTSDDRCHTDHNEVRR
jgi:hypothetical protein